MATYNHGIYETHTDHPFTKRLHPREPFCGGTNHNWVWLRVNADNQIIQFLCTRCGDDSRVAKVPAGKFFV